MEKGYVHIYYGDGKGKTSILNGSAIRAAMQGLNVEYLRFFKNIKSGEYLFFSNNDSKLKIKFSSFYHFSSKFIWEMNPDEIQKFKKETLEGIKYFEKIIKNKNIDLVLADELLDAIINKFITDEELAKMLMNKSENVEVMLSGHILPKKCSEISDLITTLKKSKHYFDKGLNARKGIEF